LEANISSFPESARYPETGIFVMAMAVVAKGQSSRRDSVRGSEKDILTVYQQGHVPAIGFIFAVSDGYV
jgi:hypothetical protein